MYQTKVMKPSNMQALARARELLEEEVVRAEANKDQGAIIVEVLMKDGGSTGLRIRTEKDGRLNQNASNR